MKTLLQIWLIGFASSVFAQELTLPPRATNAPDGDEFVQQITALDLKQRDEAIAKEFLAGNTPDFLRKLCPVSVTNVVDGVTNHATFFATPDYLAIGTDTNYFLVPISPVTAQSLADKLNCTLPTRKMVDTIYAAAEVKLAPMPLPPTAAMITVPYFAQHNEIVRAQRLAVVASHPLGALVAGHQKDVVITPRLASVTNRIAIYGWQRTNGTPIQPLYLGHVASWVDYSQCIRLVSQNLLVNGSPMALADVFRDPKLCGLISDEGVVTNARYATNLTIAMPPVKLDQPWPAGFSATSHFDEWEREIKLTNDVRILINAPSPATFSPDKPVLLVFFALPNGNTIEQTFGKRKQPGDDWHFDIQHIGAQTRWLRQTLTNKTIVVAYLEATPKSWPAWRKQHGNSGIPAIFDGVRGIFASSHPEVVLTSHSGGGSLILGYLAVANEVPPDVRRIAFLDSDYSYDTGLHGGKIKAWLAASPLNALCVIAYQDYLALSDGKPFVSEKGGTWGRSHLFMHDLSEVYLFNDQTNASNGLEFHSALNGRIEFLLKENPEKTIYHTVQVERNGFIQGMLSGTPAEGKGYEYFKDRAYAEFIQ